MDIHSISVYQFMLKQYRSRCYWQSWARLIEHYKMMELITKWSMYNNGKRLAIESNPIIIRDLRVVFRSDGISKVVLDYSGYHPLSGTLDLVLAHDINHTESMVKVFGTTANVAIDNTYHFGRQLQYSPGEGRTVWISVT